MVKKTYLIHYTLISRGEVEVEAESFDDARAQFKTQETHHLTECASVDEKEIRDVQSYTPGEGWEAE
jgi:hypothetical protein